MGVLFFDQLFKNYFLISGKIQKNYNSLFGIEINYFFAIIILLFFLTTLFQKKIKHESQGVYLASLALIFGGVTSNLIDKIKLGFIIDYILFFNLFIFNLADLAILFGAGLFIWQIIKE